MPVPTRRIAWLSMATVLLSAAAAHTAGSDARVAEAVKRGDSRVAAALVTQGADVNAPQGDGATALHWAALHDDLLTADLLIRAGAKASVANDLGVTPLSLASTNGSAAMIKRLVQAGASPNTALPTGELPLMTAARTGRAEAVRALLVAGAAVNATSPGGQTALMWAANDSQVEATRTLIEAGADVHASSNTGFNALMFAARAGATEVGRVLLASGATIDAASKDGTTALVVATVRGNLPFANLLLERGADPNLGPGYTPLHWAVGRWDTGVTAGESGLIARAGDWAAMGGLQKGKVEYVRTLLAHGADVNARILRSPPRFGFTIQPRWALRGATPFLLAALNDDLPLMRLLLASGATPAINTERNMTPLIAAAGFGRVPGETRIPESESLETVKFLVEELKQDVNAADDDGDTPLHSAAYAGADSVVPYLVGKHANLEARNDKDQTPLVLALTQTQTGAHPTTAAVLRALGAVGSLGLVEEAAGEPSAKPEGTPDAKKPEPRK